MIVVFWISIKQKLIFPKEVQQQDNAPHKGRVFNTKQLDEANIEYSFEKPDEVIKIKPSFDYQYNGDSAWDFLKNYFLFSSILRNTAPIENEVKGMLMDWEAESKGLIDVHRIGLETCRYNKGFYLKTYSDVAWAFHAKFDEPLPS